MSTVELTDATFNDTVTGNDIVLIDFWAEWCGPCRMFSPVYERVSEDHPEIVFAKVDTEDQQQLAGAFDISSIPTLMAIREGVVLYAQAGALPEPALRNLVSKISELDMAEVHREVTRASAAAEG